MDTRTALDFPALLLDTLGYQPDEFVSIGHDAGGQFTTAVMAPAEAAAFVAKLPHRANVYFGVNPVRGPARAGNGRGKAEDVTRLAALCADLDVKKGASADIAVAEAIITDLSVILGTRPSAITRSGHGLHPYWPVADGRISSCNVAALLRRWGRLVRAVAEKYGARTDSVFDLPRMLRVPGTTNSKAKTNGHRGIPATCYADTGGPLTVAEIDERLNEYGAYEEDEDTRDLKVISSPVDWTFATQTCSYVAELIGGLLGDGPLTGKGRHPWVLKQAVRLACAQRLSCISETDWHTAQKLLDTRLCALRAATGQTTPDYEVPAAFRFGIERASTKTEAEARAELKNHKHVVPHGDSGTPGNDTAPDLDDAHIGPYIAEHYLAAEFLYSKAFGWMHYDDRRWEPVADGIVAEVIRQAVIDLQLTEAQAGVDAKRLMAISRLFSANRLRSVLWVARNYLTRRGGEFDAHPELLNVCNGVIDLRDGTRHPHDPKLLFTKATMVAYRPGTTHADWNKALSAVSADEARWLQVRFGQGLTGHPPSDDILVVLKGSGENGKSTIIDAVRGAVGAEYAIPLPDRVLLSRIGDHPTELMTLRDARLAFMEEFPELGHLNVKRLKDLTGTEWMSARLCGKDTVNWKATHSVFVTTNYLPRVDESDHGTWRRLALVDFVHRYRKPGEAIETEADLPGDPGLRERMRRGGDGRHEAVLAWLVEGAVRWYRNGRTMPEPPTSVVKATAEWRRSADLLLRYCDDRLVFNSEAHVMSKEVYEDFKEWLNEHGHVGWTDQSFTARFGQHPEVTAHGVQKKKIRLTAQQTLSRRPQPFWQGYREPVPGQYWAWLGVRFRALADDQGDAC